MYPYRLAQKIQERDTTDIRGAEMSMTLSPTQMLESHVPQVDGFVCIISPTLHFTTRLLHILGVRFLDRRSNAENDSVGFQCLGEVFVFRQGSIARMSSF